MRFDDLVKYILSEAPIVGVELDSERFPHKIKVDHNDGYSDFSRKLKADFNLIRSKKYRERLQAETARNIPFNIKLIFIDTATYSDEGGFVDFEEEIKPTPGVITLVTEPSGDPMLLSSKKRGVWMVGHKLGHALENVIGLNPIYRILDMINNYIPNFNTDIYYKNQEEEQEIYRDISGFNSAQQGTLESPKEYIYDLVAQYVMFGKVTFRVGKYLQTKEIADKLSKEVTNFIVSLLNDCVGKVLYDLEIQ